MAIYNDISELDLACKRIITIGSFDGVHLGHRELIIKTVSDSKKNGLINAVLTFEPHPRKVISENFDGMILTTAKEKVEILKKLGVQDLIVLNFTKELAGLSAQEFIDRFVKKVGAAKVVLGKDHRLGKDRSSDSETISAILRSFNIESEIIEQKRIGDEIVSSTKIREALREGNLAKANSFLGRNYFLYGKVTSGDKRGSILGFPTANIEPERDKMLPKIGVYAVIATINGSRKKAMMNAGFRPTFDSPRKIFLEANIFNFSSNIYGSEIKIEFVSRLRDEIKFSSKEELIKQLKIDKKETEEILKNEN